MTPAQGILLMLIGAIIGGAIAFYFFGAHL